MSISSNGCALSAEKRFPNASTSEELPGPSRQLLTDINSLEDIYKNWDNMIPPDRLPIMEQSVLRLCELDPRTPKEFNKAMHIIRKEIKSCPKKSHLLHVFRTMEADGRLPPEVVDHSMLGELLVRKKSKSGSGVLVITVLTSPHPGVRGGKKQRFSCQWNCHYCPAEPGQPRSYLHDEPAVLRANRDQFCPILQFHDRAATLALNGHPIDKVELLVLGGTWASYPHNYQEEFCRDLFYAANTFWDRQHTSRDPYSLEEEQKINERARTKIIGLTLETRPDCINMDEMRRFRKYGCTRIQIGVQHTHDDVSKLVNRGHGLRESVDGVRLLLNNCFKVDMHLMPDLPGSTILKDQQMLERVLYSEDLRADQLKLYPHSVVPWTVTKKWLDNGDFTPMSDHDLTELLIWFKTRVHPWIRLNRVVRDIPGHYISGGNAVTNLRQVLHAEMKHRGYRCKCIRCREVGHARDSLVSAQMFVRKFHASGGTEYFISFETPNRHTIFGFLRLRITRKSGTVEKRFQKGLGKHPGRRIPSYEENYVDEFTRKVGPATTPWSTYSQKHAHPEKTDVVVFPELLGCALVRELHVYGQLITTRNKEESHAQHAGFGRRMMKHAEKIAASHGLNKIAVIAGVGTRNYYRKLGYVLRGRGRFLVKKVKLGPRLYYSVFPPVPTTNLLYGEWPKDGEAENAENCHVCECNDGREPSLFDNFLKAKEVAFLCLVTLLFVWFESQWKFNVEMSMIIGVALLAHAFIIFQ
eukprot:g4214.t1